MTTGPRQRVLLFGGSGWIGDPTRAAFDLAFECASPRSRDLDVRDRRAVHRVVATFRPHVVVNLAARMRGDADEETMRAVNETGAAHVAEAAAAAGARLVHMSSDLVLDGRSAPYTDDAEAAPLDPYGASKAAGERAVLAAHPSPLVLRTSLVVDPYVPDRLSRSCLERMARGERVTLFTDEIRCPIARGTLARALVELAASAASGRLNVAGADAVSRHELGLLLFPRFGARDLSLVRAASAAEHPEPRPRDLRLDTSRARALLRTPLRGIREELSVPRS